MDHVAVIDAIYQGSVRPELWSDTLCSIIDYVGASAGNIVYQDPTGRSSFLIPGRMRDDLNSLYLEHYTKNPYARAFEKAQPGQVAIGNALVDAPAVRRSSYYADICAPQDIYNQLFVPHASLHQPGGIGGVALFLSRRQDEHVLDAAARLKRVMPHIIRAMEFSLQTRRIGHGPDLTQRLIDALPDAAWVIGMHGEIVLCNGAAEVLIRQADGILLSRSNGLALQADDSETSTRLAEAIRKAMIVAHGEDVEFHRAFPIPRPSGLSPYLALITPLAPSSFSLWDARDGGGRVLVQIVDADAKIRAQARQLQIICKLTDAETRVAALVGNGMSQPEIAQALGVSVNTVKTHIGRCFAKAEVRSQVGLARLIAGLPVPEGKAIAPFK
jgi:DNA-binding CsgD family transcriptional regulator